MRGERHFDSGDGGGPPIDVKKKTAKDFADALHPERSAGREANPAGFDPGKTLEKKKQKIDISDILPKPGEERPDVVGDEIQARFEELQKADAEEDAVEAKADADFEQSAVRLVTDNELAADAVNTSEAERAANAETKAVMQAQFDAEHAAAAIEDQSRISDQVDLLAETNPMLSYDVKSARIRPQVQESSLSKLKRGFSDLFARKTPAVEQSAKPIQTKTEAPKATEFITDLRSTTGVISARNEAPQEKQGFFSRLFKKPDAGVSSEMQTKYQDRISETRGGNLGRFAKKRIETIAKPQAPGYQERNVQGYREGKPLPKGDYRYTSEETSPEQDAAAAYLEQLAQGDTGVSGEEKEQKKKVG